MDTNLSCEHCNKTFSTKSNLTAHRKTNKNCCKNNIEKFSYKCDYCLKSFTSTNGLCYHLNVCLIKKEKEDEKKAKENKIFIETLVQSQIESSNQYLKNELQKQKQDLDREIQTQKRNYLDDIKIRDDEIQKLRTVIEVLENKLEIYKLQNEKYERQIEILQTQPKVSTNKTTNRTTINNDKSIVFNQYFTSSDLANGMKDFNENHIAGGMTFLAAYVKEKFLTKDGKLIYTCTDAARQFFKFMYEGIEIKDKTAMMLVKTLKPAIIDKVSKIIKYLHETKDRLDNIPKTRRTCEEKDKLALTNFLIENKVYKFDVDVRELEKNHMLSLELSRII